MASPEQTEATGQVTHEAEQKAEELTERARAKLGETQKRAARELQGIASAFEAGAAQLRRQGQDAAAGYADRAASVAERLGHRVEERGISELMSELEQFGREQPVLLAGGAAAIGFVLTRILKSSTGERGGT